MCCNLIQTLFTLLLEFGYEGKLKDIQRLSGPWICLVTQNKLDEIMRARWKFESILGKREAHITPIIKEVVTGSSDSSHA